MKLRLYDDIGLVDTSFGEWLKPKIATRIISSIDSKKLLNWNEYINKTEDITRLYSKTYHVEELLIFAAKHLKCNGSNGNIYIEVDPNILAPGFDRVKLSAICNMINSGSLSIKGYPIFSEVFQHFKENITTYVRMYYLVLR